MINYLTPLAGLSADINIYSMAKRHQSMTIKMRWSSHIIGHFTICQEQKTFFGPVKVDCVSLSQSDLPRSLGRDSLSLCASCSSLNNGWKNVYTNSHWNNNITNSIYVYIYMVWTLVACRNQTGRQAKERILFFSTFQTCNQPLH